MASFDPNAMTAFHRKMIVQHLRDLVQRKERLFPGDRRMIAKVVVLDEGESVRVLVTSSI